MGETAYVLAWLVYHGDAIVVKRVGIFSERTPTVADENERGCWALIVEHHGKDYQTAAELAEYMLRTYFPMLATKLEEV